VTGAFSFTRENQIYKRRCRFRGTFLVLMGSDPAVQRSDIDPSDVVRSLSRMAYQDATAGHMGSTLRGDIGSLILRRAGAWLISPPQSGDHLSKLR
jgi:hypothetical protein